MATKWPAPEEYTAILAKPDTAAYRPKRPLDDNWNIGPEEKAFELAIAAAPLDDAPRLVYADWLKEKDDGCERELELRKRCQAFPGDYATVDAMVNDLLNRWNSSRELDAAGAELLAANDRRSRAHRVGILRGTHGEKNMLIVRHAGFFQSVRSGTFLRHPIQRVIIADRLPVNFDNRWWWNLSRWQNQWGTMPTLTQVDMSVVSDHFDIRGPYSLYIAAMEALSNAAVCLGRLASGLAEIDLPHSKDPDYFCGLWRAYADYIGFNG